MRLTTTEQLLILKAFKEVFKTGKVYLFGSRVDDTKKGGDIDLYLIIDENIKNKHELKIKFLTKLEKYLGEQKIDIVIANNTDRYIEQVALRDGIMLDEKNIRIEKYLNECKKHSIRIEKAYNKVKNIFPLSAKKYENLNDEEIEAIDQYLFRFAKLQDTIGEKLFKLIVSEYVEDIEQLTFIDILNKLEKIGIIDNVNDWKILRKIRNDISHQYDDEPQEMAEALNNIFAQKDVILDIFKRILKFYNKDTK